MNNTKIIEIIRGTTKVLKVYINRDNQRLLSFSDVELVIKDGKKYLYKIPGLLNKTIKNTYYYKFNINHNVSAELNKNAYKIMIRGMYKDKLTYLEDKKDLKLYLEVKDNIF